MILNGMQSPDPKPPGTSDFSAIDLTDLDVFTGGFPHQIFELLRREAPIWWHPPTAHTPDREGFWVVSRHADVVRVFLDHETFSSETGGSRPRGGTMIMDSPSSGVMLNMMDDPRHLRIRQLVNKGFTPRIIRQMEGDLRKRAHDIVDRLCDADHCEFVVDIARELPLQAICALLAKTFNLPKSNISIDSGHTRPQKRIAVKGLTVEQIQTALAPYIGGD